MSHSRTRWAAAIVLGVAISTAIPGCITTTVAKYAYHKYEAAKERKEEKKQRDQMARERQQQPPPPPVQGTTQ